MDEEPQFSETGSEISLNGNNPRRLKTEEHLDLQTETADKANHISENEPEIEQGSDDKTTARDESTHTVKKKKKNKTERTDEVQQISENEQEIEHAPEHNTSLRDESTHTETESNESSADEESQFYETGSEFSLNGNIPRRLKVEEYFVKEQIDLTNEIAFVTDINDPNRCGNLPFKYGDLFDTRWTMSYEELSKTGMSFKDKAGYLKDILMSCYKMSEDYIQKNWRPTVNRLTQNAHTSPEQALHQLGGDQAFDKKLRNMALKDFSQNKDTIIKELLADYLPQFGLNDNQLYVTDCMKITLEMVLQNPAVVLFVDVAEGSPTHSSFNSYGDEGDTVDFVVWPALHTSTDGFLLRKGFYKLK